MADLSSLEPLLPDDRVGRLGEMLRLAFPSIPPETQVVSFIVPVQLSLNEETGEPIEIPEQAVFGIISDNPRGSFDAIYRGKTVMTTAGMLRSAWERDAKARKHFVTTLEDPAWKFVQYAARTHLRKLQDLRELI